MTKIFFSAIFSIGVLIANIGVTYAEGSTGPAPGYCPDDPHSRWHDLAHCGTK